MMKELTVWVRMSGAHVVDPVIRFWSGTVPSIVRFWQPNIVRQISAAKGNMGACPQERIICPD
jgi:hypothetical protein